MTRSYKKTWKRLMETVIVVLAGTLASGPLAVWSAQTQKQGSGHGAEARNMRLVGANDLQARLIQPGRTSSELSTATITDARKVAVDILEGTYDKAQDPDTNLERLARLSDVLRAVLCAALSTESQ